ncbi:hypothetical protein BDN70DRAFT_876820 [Pholiota conissans]|uniref:Acyltransferase 3 domain-containing protein n=1 Tax=Pholiota conissans TaxID=109636 RepID=A0A9P5Z4T4_9AGAR|nr:hypothetical protein BDN70DRAFT_876820 [Pholiota conissans]
MAGERTPLLGVPVPGPIAGALGIVQRIHFLDNIRTILTIFLVFHHAAIYVARSSLSTPYYNKSDLLPLSLFIVFNKATLYGAFFFASGYSIHLSLKTKSDLAFFVSRTLKTGLPTLLYHEFGPRRKIEGPVPYVVTLLILDYAYLISRWLGSKWSFVSFRRLETRIKDSRAWVMTIVIFSFALVTGITVGNCFGLRLIPFIVRRYYPFEFPGFGAPVTYIIAYIAGINFPLFNRYILIPRPSVAVGLLVVSELAADLSLGIAQDHWKKLWYFIRVTSDSEGGRWFIDPGFNGHTIFFTLWNPLVFYLISISFVSTFASASFTRKDWGRWSRHTYIQTFIHMVPVIYTSRFLAGHSSVQHPIVNTVLSGTAGVIGSWAISLLYVYLGGPALIQKIYDRLRRAT